jgi:tetratricopeptide (TPR) repeat protein
MVRYGLLLLVVVYVASEFPHEVARWYLAAALEAYAQGDAERAIQHATRAIAWDPERPRPYELRARSKLDVEDLDGSLEDCNRALERVPEDPGALVTRTLVYQRLGRHEDAIRDWAVVVGQMRRRYEDHSVATPYELANALNNRAYARALGQIEIDRGLDDIQEAFEVLGREDQAHMLDTRGYLRYLAGDYLLAQDDLERAIDLAKSTAQWSLVRDPDRGSAGRLIVADAQTQEELAVMFHHRGLVNEKLGKRYEAEADLKLAEELGYDPERGVW